MTIKGKYCDETYDDPCVSSPCQRGMCQKIDEMNFSCICDDGYTGHLCDTDQDQQTTIIDTLDADINEDDGKPSLCDPSPCYPGVSCSHQDWYFTCGPCPPGLTGDGITCHTCSYNDVTCGHVYDETPCDEDTEDCFTDHCLSYPCYPGVDCVSLGHSYTCGTCPDTMIGDGHTCHTPACESSPCYTGVQCSDTDAGDYTCGSCPANMTGDGITCTPDYCAINNPCYTGVTCYNTDTRAKCGHCPPGYEGNGVKCTVDNDACASNPCYHGVQCINVRMGDRTGYVCGLCPDGMEGDGETCTITDTCAHNTCYPGVTCTPLNDGTYTCGSCPYNMSGDGEHCEHVDMCSPNTCYIGVTCTTVGGQPRCGVCPPGTSGDGHQCTDIDDCSPNPCYPGVTCTDVSAPSRGYTCHSCPADMVGDGITCNSPVYITCPSHISCHPEARCIQLPGDNIECSCPLHVDQDKCSNYLTHDSSVTCPPGINCSESQRNKTLPQEGSCTRKCK